MFLTFKHDGKHRGKGKMPDYSGNLPCIRQVNQFVLHRGQGLILEVSDTNRTVINELMPIMLYSDRYVYTSSIFKFDP